MDEIIELTAGVPGWEEARQQTKATVAVDHPIGLDVAAIRSRIKSGCHTITQREFGLRFGFSPAIVRDWEQGRRKPAGPARALLLLIARDPDGVAEVLRASMSREAPGLHREADGGTTPEQSE